jgi:heterodisulfide reductase subunit C
MASTAAAAIRAAIAAAKAEAKIKSPSRKMFEIGDYMGQGLVNGLARRVASAREAGKKMANAVFDKNFAKALQKAVNQADSIFKNLLSKAGKGGASAIRRQFEGDLKHLNTLAKQHEKLMKAYDKAASKLQSIKRDMLAFQREVAQTVIEFGNPVEIGDNYSGIVTSMQDAAAQAKAFEQVIKGLIKAGLNPTTLKQILAAGPETGLATAQAILAGGVKQINLIQKQINAAAKGVGKASGQELFGGLLNAAESDVNKLIKKLAPLQKQLRQFAKDLVDALRDQMNREFAKAKTESTAKVNTTQADKPKSASGGAAKAAKSSVAGGSQVTFIYNAAPGSASLSSEEQLFAAAKRGRMAFSV